MLAAFVNSRREKRMKNRSNPFSLSFICFHKCHFRYIWNCKRWANFFVPFVSPFPKKVAKITFTKESPQVNIYGTFFTEILDSFCLFGENFPWWFKLFVSQQTLCLFVCDSSVCHSSSFLGGRTHRSQLCSFSSVPLFPQCISLLLFVHALFQIFDELAFFGPQEGLAKRACNVTNLKIFKRRKNFTEIKQIAVMEHFISDWSMSFRWGGKVCWIKRSPPHQFDMISSSNPNMMMKTVSPNATSSIFNHVEKWGRCKKRTKKVFNWEE